MRPLQLVVLLLIAACSAKMPTASAPTSTQDMIFTGMCDASGAVALSDDLFAVADDEDNVLRIYDARHGGAAVATSDALADMALDLASAGKPKRPKKERELDIEGAT